MLIWPVVERVVRVVAPVTDRVLVSDRALLIAPAVTAIL
jgi:hypothetical protein